MSKLTLWTAVLWLGARAIAGAAETRLDFSLCREGTTPEGYRSLLAGQGLPGEWKVVMADFPPALAPFGSDAPNTSRRRVLAQLSTERTDERFPLLMYEGASFGDFTLTTRIQMVSGTTERMAGIAFRLQDERNFYVVRASSLGGNVRFYKVVNGERGVPVGNSLPVPAGVWHTLKIDCKGTRIRVWLDDKEAVPELNDTSFAKGRIAFWTKSDSVSYFGETLIQHPALVVPAQALVTRAMQKNPKLLDLRIFMPMGDPPQLKVVASKDPADLGQPGGANEADVLANGNTLCRRDEKDASVLMPLRDRNGDVLAAVRFRISTFAGQTDSAAVIRVQPILQAMQKDVRERKDLVDE